MRVVVDCCSLVHAKAMTALPHAPLGLLAQLAERGARYACTKPVLGELGESSLRDTLAAWSLHGWIEDAAPMSTERKHILNQLRRSDCIPGKNDVGLVVIAHRLGVPLLTHDAGAAHLALRCGVPVIDLIDMCAWAARAGVATLVEISEAWGALAGLPWPGPHDPWHGSVLATVAARPCLDEVLARLMAS